MTSFDKIEDLALTVCQDYKLGKLYEQDEDKFKKVCDGFLVNAASQFVECRQSLDYDTESRSFNADLTNLEIYILSRYWVISWWERETNNAAQIALKLKVSSSFTFNSEAQILLIG